VPADSTDEEWEKWGAKVPYYAVLTDPKFRTASLTREARANFFALGVHHSNEVLDRCRRLLAPAFSPRQVLKLGCGAGRLVIPLASQAKHVVDVARSMLEEARRSCAESGVGNASFVRADDDPDNSYMFYIAYSKA
jgi:2-polyprenyl-3-methyl-5-hydroxy-6-metoxy-1,4-benzoquinol methylase